MKYQGVLALSVAGVLTLACPDARVLFSQVDCQLPSFILRERVPEGELPPMDDRFGLSLAAADVDLDGYDDIVVSTPQGPPTGCGPPPGRVVGKVAVYSGRTLELIGELEGDGPCDNFGRSIARLGGVLNDGRDAVAVGAPDAAGGKGRVYVYSFTESGWEEVLPVPVVGQAAGDHFGESVSRLGDLNGDGKSEIAVGAPHHGSSGKVYVVDVTSGEVLLDILGQLEGEGFGWAVAGGDFDADGDGDLVVGSLGTTPTTAGSGRVSVFTVPAGALLFERHSFHPGDRFGGSVATVGDVGGDAADELLVGASAADGRGKAYLFLGGAIPFEENPEEGTRGKLHRTWEGPPGSAFGAQVAAAGDVNRDGVPDVAVSAPTADAGDIVRAGQVHVYSGTDQGLLHVLQGPGPEAYLGRAISPAGDLDGDGASELIASHRIQGRGEALLYLLGDRDGDGVRDACEPCISEPIDLGEGERKMGEARFTLLRYARVRCFAFPIEAGKTLRIALEDEDPEDANSLYLGWGEPPSPASFDQAAQARFQASQGLIVPFTRGQTCFLLAQANILNGGANEVRLVVEEVGLLLGGMTPNRVGLGGDRRLSALVNGAGFAAGIGFALVSTNGGKEFEAEEVEILSPERAAMVFDLSGADEADEGSYDLVAGEDDSRLQGAFLLEGTDIGDALAVSLSGRDFYRYDTLERLTLKYANRGDRVMDAPIFKVVGPPGTQYRFGKERFLHEDSVYVMGFHPGGIAGKLPPQVEMEIAIWFRSTYYPDDPGDCADEGCPVLFSVSLVEPKAGAQLPFDQLVKPEDVSEAEWQDALAALGGILGRDWREYNRRLSEIATRLDRRGGDAASVRQAFHFAMRQAYGRPVAAISGTVVAADDKEPLVGVTVVALEAGQVQSHARSDRAGNYTLDWLWPGRTYQLGVLYKDVGEVTVSLPEQGDRHGVLLEASDAPDNDWTLDCPDCDLRGLPEEPPSPPAGLLPQYAEKPVSVVSSVDPNVKTGSGGQGGNDLTVSRGQEIIFTIHFENTGTAGPRRIVIIDELDPKLDWTTVELRDVYIPFLSDEDLVALDLLEVETEGSGSTLNLAYEAEALRSMHVEFQELSYDADILISATVSPAAETTGVDEEHGVITWILDAENLPFPGDGREGLLAWGCESETGEDGEIITNLCSGYVSFAVQPREDLEGGDEIANEASIKFCESDRPETCSEVSTTSEEYPAVVVTYTGDPTPETPRDPSPGQGDIADVQDTRLHWQGESADGYELYLWRAREGATRPDEASKAEVWMAEPEGNAYPAGNEILALEEGIAYSWQVLARNAQGDVWGEVWSFTASGEPPFVRGDINDSGGTDVSDPIFLLLYLFAGGDEPHCLRSADADSSDGLEVTDAVHLLGYLFLGGSPPEEPFGECGRGSSPGELTCQSFATCQ